MKLSPSMLQYSITMSKGCFVVVNPQYKKLRGMLLVVDCQESKRAIVEKRLLLKSIIPYASVIKRLSVGRIGNHCQDNGCSLATGLCLFAYICFTVATLSRLWTLDGNGDKVVSSLVSKRCKTMDNIFQYVNPMVKRKEKVT